MKQTAFFINIGRGMTTRLDDLAAALEAGEIAGAGLDVFEQEPLPADHKLWTLPGVLITPHTAGYGPYLDDRRYEIILDNCRRFLAGAAAAQPRRQGALVLTDAAPASDLGDLLPFSARQRQDTVAKMLGIDPSGVAGHLVIATVFEKPFQRILPLGPAGLVARAHRGGADRVLQRPLHDRAPQLALGKSALRTTTCEGVSSMSSRHRHSWRRLTAAVLPCWPRSMSKLSRCPSRRLPIPERSTAEIWTNTSFEPSSGWMNP